MLIGFNEGALSTLVLIAFIIILLFVVGIFLTIIMKSLSTWTSNNNAPIQDRVCRVVAKRIQFSGSNGHIGSNTSYYVTFEFDDLSRMELWIGRQQFGYMVEGDTGNLTFQGTRFKEFERKQAVKAIPRIRKHLQENDKK
ncbi:DUF2500 domain-containing protein [Paenibacillus qinlingensis]|uniref:Alpha/beta hydrolase family protein n=1 Tax=Paenibacillus qinlingensis TaxID=1837343 RepID=A0ABU1NYH8_9BACL|nr:DUF2500 domain-containing protein [Paenibacillus qinlingensis]MDR6552533.1 putative alpha/beta hydrolase family protein [Paenibacillus qinlingensis]